ncbi:MerR family transcriptional regulator [Krasilnikoviella flava]|uniref:DNA-binding transcriptional regulator, MerR family n=1 Tax=Krasilnikoviella flava TaxID=526729 RepID=A0A1T5K2I2_9MICO|nr:MerR family transcriptional regulator [Krasilnikoviella flava]SKC57699.1 DNA-binding transcriptional regulator, MerR family [Krasilnikoviella flava]
MTTTGTGTTVGIREVAEHSGLSVDALRWYEREGLLPRAPRGPDGRRRYPERLVGFVRLVVALRRTGMPVADVREFVALTDDGAASHGRRMALLERQRENILRQQAQLADDLAAVGHKIEHYRELIAAGLDCEGLPVPPDVAAVQCLPTLQTERTAS